MRRLLLGIIAVLFLAVTAWAAGPTTVTFPASPDHNTVVNGVTVLTSYRVDVFGGASTLSKDCGKPTVVGGNVTCPLPTGLPNNVALTAKAVAVGPGGESAGPASDPFANVAAPAAPGKPTVQ
jgi:hypothetical protein